MCLLLRRDVAALSYELLQSQQRQLDALQGRLDELSLSASMGGGPPAAVSLEYDCCASQQQQLLSCRDPSRPLKVATAKRALQRAIWHIRSRPRITHSLLDCEFNSSDSEDSDYEPTTRGGVEQGEPIIEHAGSRKQYNLRPRPARLTSCG
eukprot:jgi/Mesen1/132/ME1127843C07665